MDIPLVSTDLPTDLVAGAVAGLPVLLIYLYRAVSLSSFSEAPIVTALLQSYMLLGSVVVAGAPVTLYVRFGTVTPLGVGGLLLVPALIEQNPGEIPAFGLLVFVWPICLGVYLGFAVIESLLRERGLG